MVQLSIKRSSSVHSVRYRSLAPTLYDEFVESGHN